MRVMAIPSVTHFDYDGTGETPLHRRQQRWTWCLLVSIALTTFCGAAGLGIAAASFISRPTPAIGAFGTASVIVTFPLLVLVAHCLDKIDETDKAIRIDYCKRHWMKDEEC